MQWARHYLQRTSDFMRDNPSPEIDDAIGEGTLPHPFHPEDMRASLEDMDRALYATWRGLLTTLAETRQLLPPGSMPDLIMRVEDPPIPPAPRAPRY